jgi:hypothetical protein
MIEQPSFSGTFHDTIRSSLTFEFVSKTGGNCLKAFQLAFISPDELRKVDPEQFLFRPEGRGFVSPQTQDWTIW